MLIEKLFPYRSARYSASDSPIWFSLLKTISWRIVGTLDTLLISYLITGDLGLAASIGGIEIFSKMLLYFIHERVWNKIKLR